MKKRGRKIRTRGRYAGESKSHIVNER